MWRTLFIGWLAVTLAEDVRIIKRQSSRGGSSVIYGASPGQYSIQTQDRVAARGQPQVSADYQQQSELYVISPNRKPSGLGYSGDSSRRPQYIQVSALQLQAAQQILQHQQLQQQQLQHQPVRQQLTYDSEAGHGLYRPAVRIQQQQIQDDKSSRAPVQYAASAIVDSQLYPQGGSFERELAQLVAANRAQEQKYNVATGVSAQKKHPGPQQYLKEVSRPATRPLVPIRAAPAHQSAPQVQYQQIPQQPQQIYRYVYQPEQLQQIQAAAQQYKSAQEQQYIQPQIQQYLQHLQQVQQQSHVQPQVQPQLLASHGAQAQALRQRNEEEAQAQAAGLRAHGLSSARLAAASTAQTEAPSRSTIFVSQSTPLKKTQYSSSEREEEVAQAPKVPALRLPTQRNRPLTQEEFQNVLQSGGYTATLVPSDDPNSPHQEYLLHPTGAHSAQRPIYTNEKQEPVTYLLPQSHQRGTKRRPVYNVQA